MTGAPTGRRRQPAQLSGGAALVAALVAHGVDTVFGIPGTHNLPVYAALGELGLRHVSPRHEQGAAFAADGYARVSGRPGVCLTTTGPGLLNAVTGAAQAYSDSVPVLLVSPGLPLRHPSAGNGYLHEVKDQRGALAAVVAASIRVTSLAEIPVAVAQAFALMTSGRPRPVHLEVPLDLLAESGQVQVVAPVPVPPVAPAPAQVRDAVDLLAGAVRPLVLVGGGAAGAAAELELLAERLAAPVLTTANGKGTLPEDHPLSLGAGLHHPAVAGLIADSDVLLAVGTELAPSDAWTGLPTIPGRLVRVDVDPLAVLANAVPDVAVVGDARLALLALLAALPPRAVPGGPERCATWRGRLQAEARAEGRPWLTLLAALGTALGRDGVVAGDSTMACYYGALSNLPRYRPRSFLYPTGLGTLGYAVPAAIGAKLARPDLPVLALSGDGGLMFTVAELASAACLGLSLPVVVVDNGGYGEIGREMRDRGDPVQAVALGAPDFPALARALGCHGLTVTGPEQLAVEVRRALSAGRPTVLHVRESDPAWSGQ